MSSISEPAAKKRKKEALRLTLNKEEPTVFVDTTFQLSMYLENDDGEIHSDHADLPLQATLSFEADDDAPPKGCLVVDEEAVIVKGKGTLKCHITSVSMDLGNRKFTVELKPASKS